MRILFLSTEHFDYQNSMILHGLRFLYGNHVVDYPKQEFMYKNFPNMNREQFHGQGFTITQTLENFYIDREYLEERIKEKVFDCIVYGNVRRNIPFFDLVTSVYPRSRILLIDGEDDYEIPRASTYGLYFKRELRSDDQSIFPISFCFPEEKIFHGRLIKTQDFARSKPTHGIKIFDYPQVYDTHGAHKQLRLRDYPQLFIDEQSYYNDYRTSLFGITVKKGGWDCNRHYEIIFNKCLPYFFDIEKCPPRTLFNWNKNLLKKILTIPGVSYDSVDQNRINYRLYNELLDELFNHAKQNLTTRKICEYMISHVE